MGCLLVLGQMVAGTCFRLGALIVSVLLRAMSFLLISVIGPLGLGAVREFAVTTLRITRNGKSVQSGWQVGSRSAYAALNGIGWLLGFFILRLIWRCVEWFGGHALVRLAPNMAPWIPTAVLAALIFLVGTTVGAAVHRRDNGVGSQ